MDSETTKQILDAIEKAGTNAWIPHAIQYLLITILGFFVIKYRSYFKKKGEDLATKESIEEITTLQEKAKEEFSKRLADLNHQNQRILDKHTHRHQLSMAAIDKRMEVLQVAYTLWWDLFCNVLNGDKMRIAKSAEKCNEYFINNNLYFGSKARRAFLNAYQDAGQLPYVQQELKDAEGKGLDEELIKSLRMEVKEKHRSVKLAGRAITEAANLPDIEPEEITLRAKDALHGD